MYELDEVYRILKCNTLTTCTLIVAYSIIFYKSSLFLQRRKPIELCGEVVHNGKTYYFGKKKHLSWFQAEDYCQKLWNGLGRLARVADYYVNEWLFQNMHRPTGAWMDVSYSAYNKHWKWSNNCTAEDAVPYRVSKVVNRLQYGNKYCLKLAYAHLWNSQLCAAPAYFICEVSK